MMPNANPRVALNGHQKTARVVGLLKRAAYPDEAATKKAISILSGREAGAGAAKLEALKRAKSSVASRLIMGTLGARGRARSWPKTARVVEILKLSAVMTQAQFSKRSRGALAAHYDPKTGEGLIAHSKKDLPGVFSVFEQQLNSHRGEEKRGSAPRALVLFSRRNGVLNKLAAQMVGSPSPMPMVSTSMTPAPSPSASQGLTTPKPKSLLSKAAPRYSQSISVSAGPTQGMGTAAKNVPPPSVKT